MTGLPKTMKAVVLTGHGGLDKLEYREDWPLPVPENHEVVVKVGACGLNNTDINTRTAWYSDNVSSGITTKGGEAGFDEANPDEGSWSGIPLTFPRIQGADVCGRIAAVGNKVDPSRIGERVVIDPWIFNHADRWAQGAASYFGSECDGAFAQYTKAPSNNVLQINSDLSDAEIASMPCVITTAENLVFRTELQPGEIVAVAGASGGVGTAAVQLCLLRGARVIGIASCKKAKALMDLGCDAVIDRNEPDLGSALKHAAGGELDVALDVVGGNVFMPLLEALRQGGRYSSSGAIAGPVVEMDLRKFLYKDLKMTGATITPPGTMKRLVRLIERGQLKPQLAQTFALHELREAQETFLEKNHVGNIVVWVP